MNCEACIKSDVCSIKRIVAGVEQLLSDTVFPVRAVLPGAIEKINRVDMEKKYSILLLVDCQHFK